MYYKLWGIRLSSKFVCIIIIPLNLDNLYEYHIPTSYVWYELQIINNVWMGIFFFAST